MNKTLPSQPNLDWLKKGAKERLAELRVREPLAKLHQAQLAVARDYGFPGWRALKAHVDTLSIDGQVIAATIAGKAPELGKFLTPHPRKLGLTGGAWEPPPPHPASATRPPACVGPLLPGGLHRGQAHPPAQ